MAVSVATIRADELLKRDTQPPTYRSVERNCLKTRIGALVAFWESIHVAKCNVSNDARAVVPRQLYRPYGSALPRAGVLPTYEESVLDVPPDYTMTDALAKVHTSDESGIITSNKVEIGQDRKQENHELFGVLEKLDLQSSDHIRTHAGKKAKKAAKQAQMSKWADSDNEEKKEGEDGAAGDDNAGGGDAGGAGGDDPPGGNGGDDGDELNDSGKKGKKVRAQGHKASSV